MLKKIIEPLFKCPSNCKCSIDIKKIYNDLKIKVVSLNVEKNKPPPPIDRRSRRD